MPFEVYDRQNAKASKYPMVTIQGTGNFSLNKAAVEALGQPDAVLLLYDAEEKLIGFRPTPSDDILAYRVRTPTPKQSGRQVHGRLFAKYYRLDTTTARRYKAEMRDDTLVLDLKTGGTVVTSPRTRKATLKG